MAEWGQLWAGGIGGAIALYLMFEMFMRITAR